MRHEAEMDERYLINFFTIFAGTDEFIFSLPRGSSAGAAFLSGKGTGLRGVAVRCVAWRPPGEARGQKEKKNGAHPQRRSGGGPMVMADVLHVPRPRFFLKTDRGCSVHRRARIATTAKKNPARGPLPTTQGVYEGTWWLGAPNEAVDLRPFLVAFGTGSRDRRGTRRRTHPGGRSEGTGSGFFLRKLFLGHILGFR